MKRACNLGIFNGCQLPNGGPLISHLCYADDVLFVGTWSDRNITALNRLLRWLSLVTGVKINRSKSKVYGVGVSASEVNSFARLINCEAGSFPFVYLGIPIGVNMKKAKFWKPVVEKFTAKLSKWKARHLSFAGRMTLAKSVLGSLPSYFLSLFAAPKCVVQKLEKIRREFIWGKTNAGHKLRWVRWELIIKNRKLGGMGLGGIQSFNYAMLTKWWWRFKENPNQLWAAVVSAIHRKNGNTESHFFPLKKTITGIWKDIGSVESSMAKAGINIQNNIITVGDMWKWRTDPNGSFSVKQVRFDIESALGSASNEEVVFKWNSWVPSKVNYLLCRALIGKVASKVGLIHMGVPIGDCTCPRCGLLDEDPSHIFVGCLWARSMWWNILVWMRIPFPAVIGNISDLLEYVTLQPGSKVWKRIVYSIVSAKVWRIWKARNEMIF
ncbi:putative reverse transcriptase zinc-binding domain-containing protein [Helianthus debilis subsp. tardiflorus]